MENKKTGKKVERELKQVFQKLRKNEDPLTCDICNKILYKRLYFAQIDNYSIEYHWCLLCGSEYMKWMFSDDMKLPPFDKIRLTEKDGIIVKKTKENATRNSKLHTM